MPSFSNKNSHPSSPRRDCKPKESCRKIPPELSSVFAKIDPIENIYPLYSNRQKPLSNQITSTRHMKQLPIDRFEEILDQNDLNSIQL